VRPTQTRYYLLGFDKRWLGSLEIESEGTNYEASMGFHALAPVRVVRIELCAGTVKA